MNRREFAEALALAALTPMLGSGVGAIRWPIAGAAGAVAGAGSAAEPGGLAKALTAAIRAQYGARLSEANLSTIAKQIETGLERADKIRKPVLSNGDEPDFVFSAVRPEPLG